MTKKIDDRSDDKGLLNEILPDPTQARALERGGPRERTSAHLRKVLAAAAGMAMQLHGAGAHADATTPPQGGGGQKQVDPKGSPNNDANKPKDPPPQPPGYGVVDPMPEPYINKNPGEGVLKLTSKPAGAAISVDGVALGQKTPQSKIKLAPGLHAVTLTLPGSEVENFTVEIKKGKTASEKRVLKKTEPPK